IIDMTKNEKKHKHSHWIDMASGSMSGALTRAFVAPLDVIKIRLQLQNAPRNTARNTLQYRGVVQTALKITHDEGLRALWKGNLIAEVLWVSYAAAQFSLYHHLLRSLDGPNYTQAETDHKHYSPPTPVALVAGGVSGILATALSYPFDTVRTNIISHHQHTTIPKVARSILAADGVAGYYKGLSSSLLQIIPQISLQFATYEWFRRTYVHFIALRHNQERTELEVSQDARGQLLCGATSGAVSKFIVLPFDVVKKRLQVQPTHVTLGQCVKRMYSEEGWQAFYKGGVPSILKAGMAASLSFTIYEQTKQLIANTLLYMDNKDNNAKATQSESQPPPTNKS
ncbi:hypothetical protein SAMD00019534_043260, partial [Acytostelium subglobosum LB1]|uniref:hypothetical protein n=1 Tax=Acytostelium subglobosum LB1 TaxID=1410327 RepID=UPI00064498A9